MIKLIASDVDGTILQNGAMQPSEELFGLIRECRQKNIWFVIASGRQYPNLRRMFAPVWEDVVFVAENGALVMYRENMLFQSAVPRALGLEIMRDIEAQPGCEIQLSGKNTSYMAANDKEFVERMVYFVHNTVTVLDDVFAVEEPFLKISAYVKNGGAAAMVPYFKEKWAQRLNVVMSGDEWVDFGLASKGTALQFLQLMFALETDEMAALGDNYNDVLMFQSVGHSYVMAGADPNLREHARYVTGTVEEVVAAILAKAGPVLADPMFGL